MFYTLVQVFLVLTTDVQSVSYVIENIHWKRVGALREQTHLLADHRNILHWHYAEYLRHQS